MALATSHDRILKEEQPGSDAALTCSILSNVEQLEAFRPAWTELLARSSSNEPTLSPTWLLPWWQVFGQVGGRTLQVAAFWSGSRLVGLAPLLKRRHWYPPGVPFARLELLGSGEREGEQIYSEYLNVISERGAEAAVVNALVSAATSGLFDNWDEFVIPHMDGAGPLPNLLVEAFRVRGVPAECTTTGVAPYVPLPLTWDAYLEALPSSRRYFLRRTLRDFDKWADGKVEYRHATTRAELEAGKQILMNLHNGRWSDDGRPGMFRVPRFRAFHDAVLPSLLDEAALDLSWLTVDDEPIAALYNIVWNNKVYFYQSGRITDLPANIRPGVVIQAYALRHAIEAGSREYDFLGPSSQYKVQLALNSRLLVQVRATRCPLKERMRRVLYRGICFAKTLRHAIGRKAASRQPTELLHPECAAHKRKGEKSECQLTPNIAREQVP